MQSNFWIYLLTTAGVTYLVRMLPLVLIKKEIKNRFILSFLHYIPYAVLAVMTVPAIFNSTDHLLSAIAGCGIAIILAYFGKSLTNVALLASAGVLITELIMKYLNCF